MNHPSPESSTQQLEYSPPSLENINSLLPPWPTLDLIDRLVQALAEQDIAYCHWKSNNHLARSASGENDLDLLVSRADADRFSEILGRLGFKQTFAPTDKSMPGVLDFFGYDAGSDTFVHVHLHYQLIVGHDMTKNYRLPIEVPFLESVTHSEVFKVPAPEFEFIVFVIRMVLKHLMWDTIAIGHGRLNKGERQELAYLQERIDQTKTEAIISQYLPFIGLDLFNQCLRAIESDTFILTRIRLGQKIQKALSAYSRRSHSEDSFLKLWRRVAWGLKRRYGKPAPKKQFATGGAMLVLIGGDGAGKSTALEGLSKWLKPDFGIYHVHLGKPAWSRTTITVRGLLSLGRKLGLFPFIPEAEILYGVGTDNPDKFPGYPLLIRELCKARDRYLTYAQARQYATNGGLVLCDRFPLSQINLMDGPLIDRLVKPEQQNWLVKRMIKAEKHYYHAFVWPEVLCVLKLNPDIAVARKTTEDSDYVRARNQEIWSFDWPQTPAYVVDASHPADEVLNTLKSHIWAHL